MISPTSWPLPGLHTSITKGKNTCLFCFESHLSHFLPTLLQLVIVYLHYKLIVLFIQHADAAFLFISSVAVLSLKNGSSVQPWCVEMILKHSACFLSLGLLHTLLHKCDWSALYSVKGFKRLWRKTVILYQFFTLRLRMEVRRFCLRAAHTPTPVVCAYSVMDTCDYQSQVKGHVFLYWKVCHFFIIQECEVLCFFF